MKSCLLVLCFAVTALPGFSDQLTRRRDYSDGAADGPRAESDHHGRRHRRQSGPRSGGRGGGGIPYGDDLVVTTRSGKVRGVREVGGNGGEVDLFWGIPYAEPPIGDLRFRSPRKVKRWSGILDANRRPNSCVQVRFESWPGFVGEEMWNPNTRMDEDCLYLNVAVPRNLPEGNSSAVLLWIYGGSFSGGTSTLDIYDPKILASEESVIVASIQYRTASLGFLYLDGGEAEGVLGNAGLLDQRMAMQWIRDNIAAFGGNPDNITLFSESAGSASVAFHMLSPGSRALFSQAVLQSSAASNPWAMVTAQEATLRAGRLAELLKCPHEEGEEEYMVECLRSADPHKMVDAEWKVGVAGIMGLPFVPVLDGAFFPESPAKAMARGNFKRCRVLLGSNTNEGHYFIMYFLTNIFKKQENISITRKQFVESVKELNFFVSPVGLAAIEYEYTDWMDPDNSTAMIAALDKMVGDYQFTCPTIEFAEYYSMSQNFVYQYYFDERSSVHPWPNWTGVMHGDEINYVFGEPLNASLGYADKDGVLARDMMAYWANFAKTGNPNRYLNGSWTKTYWPVRSRYQKEFLNLRAGNLSVGKGYNARKCAFWDSYLPSILGKRAANEPSQECSTDTCFDQCTTSDHNRDPYRPPIPNYPSSNDSSSSSSSSSTVIIVLVCLLILTFTSLILVAS